MYIYYVLIRQAVDVNQAVDRTLKPVHYTEGLMVCRMYIKLLIITTHVQDKKKCLKSIHRELEELKKSVVGISKEQVSIN